MTVSLDELIERVIVDAYGDDEQLTAFEQWFDDTATFPLPASVVGVEVSVTSITYRGDERRGLEAICSRQGERHTVSLLDVVPGKTIAPDTVELIHAYRRWANAPPLPTTAS